MAELRIAVAGATGRMGRILVQEILERHDVRLAAATVRPGNALVGHDIGEIVTLRPCGVLLTDDPEKALENCDALLDFTTREAVVMHTHITSRRRTVHIIGTTGLQEAHEDAIRAASRKTRIVYDANMSFSVNVLKAVTRFVAERLGENFDVDILDRHHRYKVDAPSGTAMSLGRTVAEARGKRLEDIMDAVRHGMVGARKPGTIGFASIRVGNVVCEHEVIFAIDDDRIELVQRTGNRRIFARGAINAAHWAMTKKAGLYSMQHVIGFEPLSGAPRRHAYAAAAE